MEATNLNILSWNPRGLNDLSRRTSVKRVVEDAAASVVCVMESKLQVVTLFIVNETFCSRYDGFTYLPAVGTAGGVIVAWQSTIIAR